MGRKARQKERKNSNQKGLAKVQRQEQSAEHKNLLILGLFHEIADLAECEVVEAYALGGAAHIAGESEHGPPLFESMSAVGKCVLSDLGGMMNKLNKTEDAHLCPCCDRDEEKDTARKYDFYAFAQGVKLYTELVGQVAQDLVYKFDHTGFLARWEGRGEAAA